MTSGDSDGAILFKARKYGYLETGVNRHGYPVRQYLSHVTNIVTMIVPIFVSLFLKKHKYRGLQAARNLRDLECSLAGSGGVR